jgi:hypothetical protein
VEVHKEFPFADIDDMAYHRHTSTLLKHMLSKLEQLSGFVTAAAF